MIFKQAQEVLDGRKRQTRRPVNPGDVASHDENGKIVAVYRRIAKWDSTINEGKMRLLWKVGQTLAVQPGRGKKSLGRTPPIKAIRRERLQDISHKDAIAEGVIVDFSEWGRCYRVPGKEGDWATAVGAFEDFWNSLYPLKRYRYQGLRWRDNPEVWVLTFEPIERAE